MFVKFYGFQIVQYLMILNYHCHQICITATP